MVSEGIFLRTQQEKSLKGEFCPSRWHQRPFTLAGNIQNELHDAYTWCCHGPRLAEDRFPTNRPRDEDSGASDLWRQSS